MKELVLASFLLNFLLSPQVFSQVNSNSSNNLSQKNFSIQISNEVEPLLNLLKNKGFRIKYKTPPKRGVYGLFQSKKKTIWISPISFELGIGRQTILHEATHAAQSCPNGLLSPIGWSLPVNQSMKNEIQEYLLKNYDINQYTVEKEAFYLQSQENGVEILIEAIKKRCE